MAICPPLTVVEKSRLEQLLATARLALAAESRKQRDVYLHEQAKKVAAEHPGITLEEARRIAERQCRGILRPHFVLHFDDPDLGAVPVSAVLADPEKYDGETLADPLEPDTGPDKAIIRLHADGSPWVFSFSHGFTAYELKYDKAAILAALDKIPKDQRDRIVHVFVGLAINADLSDTDALLLREWVIEHSGFGARTINRHGGDEVSEAFG